MKLKYNFVIQKLEDKYVAVATGEGANAFKGIIRVNEVGKLVLDKLQEEISKDELCNYILSIYEGGEKKVKDDIEKFVNELERLGLIDK